MKKNSSAQKRDIPLTVAVCFAAGGIGMLLVVCLFIGFGVHTAAGSEALYISFALQAISLILIRLRERRLQALPPATSQKMQRVRLICAWAWRVFALAMMAPLLLWGIFHISPAIPWLKVPCLIGVFGLPVSWLGVLGCYHRRQLAVRSMEKTPAE